MEFGDKLKELDMTVEEMDRLGKAFKEEKFRELFQEYARELSDPDNRRRYEEEIKILEQERGNTIEFLYPEPFKAFRMCMNESQECFINICSSDKVSKPSSTPKVLDDGRRGLCWALPHILHPEAQEIYRKGHKVMVYNAIFHPDTLHVASKNKKFMGMVINTAIQGIQSAFSISLDGSTAREIRAKSKGIPQPCVIRRPTPGYKKPSRKPDRLDFPYPDEKVRPTSLQNNPRGSPVTTESCGAGFETQRLKTKEPAKPNYTLKYRSYIDIQDFRYSRNSAQSPRPKEIVVTIDVPLLKDVAGARVEAAEGRLLLESENPAYRLQLPLAYPVDEDKGEAKFNRQKGQLTVTLPVLPANPATELAVGPDDDLGETREAEDGAKVRDREEEGAEERSEGNDEEEEGRDKINSEEEGSVEEEPCEEQRPRNLQCNVDVQRDGASETENQTHLGAADHAGGSEDDGDAALNSFLESTSELRTSDVPGEMENETGSLKDEATSLSPCNSDNEVAEDYGASQQACESKTDEASGDGSHNWVPEEHSVSPQKQEREDTDEDGPSEQEPGDGPPPALLTEVDEHGNETVISDHSTSAGFTFQNSLMYELD